MKNKNNNTYVSVYAVLRLVYAMLLRMSLGVCQILQKLCIFGPYDMSATTILASLSNIGYLYCGHASILLHLETFHCNTE